MVRYYWHSLCFLSRLSILIVLASGDVKGESNVRESVDIQDFKQLNVDNFKEWFDEGYKVVEGEFDDNGQFGKQGGKAVKPNYAFSPQAMKRLVVTEAKIYNQMKNYVKTMNKRLDLMKRYLKDYEESSINGTAHIYRNETETEMQMSEKHQLAIVTNPLLTHRMIRRFSVSFDQIFKNFQTRLDEDFLQSLNSIDGKLLFPNVEEDYTQSIESLLRIQLYNNFDTKELADGNLGHITSNVGLGPRHAFELGYHAYIKDNLFLAVEWMEVALAKAHETDDHYDSPMIWEHLSDIVIKHDVAQPTWSKVNHLVFDELIGANFGPHMPKRRKLSNIRKEDALKNRLKTEYGLHTKSNFLALCSGFDLQTEEEKSKLYCWLETTKHPYWTINPLKIELLNKDPPLIQIYELIGPKTIKKTINAATPTLQRSEVINYDHPQKSDISSVRTSSQTWLEEWRFPYMEKIMSKIEFVTGLSVHPLGASEAIQVASYGTSHHYDEHLDALLDERRTAERGDRVGTFMFYLTDVEVGGKTAFPIMGTAANPIAGSAVFWHNLKKNGEVDMRTWHGGCPVVLGNKWVANKWILLNENWDKRKCSLNPNE